MKTSQELLDERLKTQDGHLRGERIKISEPIACELMEVYHSQFQNELELPEDEEIEKMAQKTLLSIHSQNAFMVGFKYAYDRLCNQKK